ncbi:MAG: hypothetical protein KIH69_012555, partial [Anaerolineae bacterium]|nr:hypothetical protein [Anaerolineae bacterium]
FTLTGVGGAQNQETPDIIRVRNPDNGHLIANYAAVEVKPSTTLTPAGLPPSRGAGIFTSQCLTYSVAFLPFGLEGVNQAAHRTDILSQILQAFVQPRPQTGFELTALNPPPTGAVIGSPGEVVTHSFRIRHTGEAGLPETFNINFGGNKWKAEASTASGPRDLHEISLLPCRSTIVTLTVSIPPDAPRNMSDALTVSITPHTWSPDHKRSLRFTSKTPAAVMLVDDDRFYDREQDYLDALTATGATVDRWDTRSSLGSQFTQSPSITDLHRYPLVVWFNGYDWFDPITPAEREVMRHYLAAGGRLFFTSQAALYYSSGPEQRQAPDFDRNVLGVNYVEFGDNVTQISGVPGSVLGDGLPSGSLLPFPYGFNLSAAVHPMPDTHVVLRGDSGQPFGLARRQTSVSNPQSPISNPISAESRLIFFPFSFEVLSKQVQAEWMNRMVGWLSPLGQSEFSATPATIPAGGQVAYSLTLRADELLNTLGAYTSTRVAISVTLPNALKVLTHTLPPGSLGNGWRGTMTQGDVLAWRIVAQHTNADIGRREVLTAHLHITLPDLGLHFSQPVAVRVNAPLLLPSIQVTPQPLQWRERATVTIGLRNVSSNDAPQVHLRHAVPTRLNLIESSLMLTPTGVGELALLGNRLDWTGALTAGHAITISYQISLPRFGFNNALAFFNQAIVDEGGDGVAHADSWLVPEIVRVLFPVMLQGQFSDTVSLTDTITTTVLLR